jgi:hypothetical protein
MLLGVRDMIVLKGTITLPLLILFPVRLEHYCNTTVEKKQSHAKD